MLSHILLIILCVVLLRIVHIFPVGKTGHQLNYGMDFIVVVRK